MGIFTIGGLTYVTNTSPNVGGHINFSQNALDPTKGIIAYRYADAAARDTLRNKVIVGRPFTLRLNSTTYVTGTLASHARQPVQSLVVQLERRNDGRNAYQ